MNHQHHHIPRAESPPDPNSHNMLHHLHSQDPLYALHGPQSGLYNTGNMNSPLHMQSEYAPEYDAQKQHQQQQQHSAKLNGFPPTNNYRASFSTYPNTNRTRNHLSQAGLGSTSFREPPNFYPNSADVFPSQMTSPIQAHMQPYDSRASYDFGAGQSGLAGLSKPYHDAYGPSSGMLPQSHPNQKGGVQQQQQQQQQGPHAGYSAAAGGYVNGMQHLSSQTPYGPHVPSSAPQAIGTSVSAGLGTGAPAGLAASGMVNGAGGAASNQEEISTIFVVGFPEDMQEREFQNMFTFSPGFEAATLKIPNKEYTAYGGLVGTSSRSAGAGGGSAGGYQQYSGSNDPYNLVTVNQGGVVVDGGRDGTVASWPAVDDGTGGAGPFLGVGGVNLPPRKQIIGFAKFRSREEALGARDVLQGRRVDIEKGAVLKAEMAKKNLHTKRGVGPVPVGAGAGAGPAGMGAGGGGMQQGMLGGGGMPAPGDPYGIGGGENAMSTRERELGAVGAMGLGLGGVRLNQWREQMQQQQQDNMGGINGVAQLNGEDERRERQTSIMHAMVIGSGRGPRERAEDEERERRKKERLRAGNSAAFDAFHSVPMQASASSSGISRQLSSVNGVNVNGSTPSLVPPQMETGSGLGSSPLLGNAFAAPPGHHMLMQQPQQHQEEIVGPWDRVNKPAPAPSSSNMVPGRPRSSSQRSTSPPSNMSSHALDQQRSFSPSLEKQFHETGGIEQQRQHRPHSESSASSIAGGSHSVVGGDGSSATEGGHEAEMSRAIDQLALNTNNGNTSPELPSPASGASSGSGRTGVDQNPPINTLYVGNLPTSPPPIGFPQDYLEENLRELFTSRPGFRRLSFRHKSNGAMCFVEFEDVQFATKALNDLYGNTLKGLIKGGGIRLSYSKNPLGVRTPTSAGSGASLQQQQQQTITPSSFAEGFQSRSGEDTARPNMMLRRDGPGPQIISPVTGSHQYNNSFLASPPPRFFSTSPGSSNTFGTPSSSTPLTGASTAFVPRGSLYSYGLGASNGLGGSNTFSPFGMSSPPPHSSIPEHSAPDDPSSHSSQHFIHRALSPPANNLEATRAG